VPLRLSPSTLVARLNTLGYFFDKYLGKYVMQFFGSDKSVVQRSEYWNYKNRDQRPVSLPVFEHSSDLI
jgi:hypothetical protein